MQRETIKFLWQATFKDNGQEIRDDVEATDLKEAVIIVDNRYGLDNFEEIKIELLRKIR